MYALRDDKTGQFVARSHSRAAAHRTSRTRRHLGASVNHAGGRSHLYLTFADVPVGGQFWFANERTVGGPRRAYVKVADKKYRHDDDVAGKFIYTLGRQSVRVTYRDPNANRAGAKSKVSKEAVAFFLKNAGSSYPVGATPAQKRAAKLAGARRFAEAEAEAERRGWKMIWEDDPEGWDSLGDVDTDEIGEVLFARVEDENGKVLASLGSIAFAKGSTREADRRYGRVVEAELAQEALGRV